jgi:hypothetical protein
MPPSSPNMIGGYQQRAGSDINSRMIVTKSLGFSHESNVIAMRRIPKAQPPPPLTRTFAAESERHHLNPNLTFAKATTTEITVNVLGQAPQRLLSHYSMHYSCSFDSLSRLLPRFPRLNEPRPLYLPVCRSLFNELYTARQLGYGSQKWYGVLVWFLVP